MFVRTIITLAGGSDARIVVIPTANPRADPAALRRAFETRGAHHVVVLHSVSHAIADSPNFAKPLRTANAVFLTGGQSMVVERAYLGTLAEREIKAVLARGGVLAGDSAGAIAIGVRVAYVAALTPSANVETSSVRCPRSLSVCTRMLHADT